MKKVENFYMVLNIYRMFCELKEEIEKNWL